MLPELNTLSNKQISTLCGLASFNREVVRAAGDDEYAARAPVLYMAMLSAIQHNRVMKEFYQKAGGAW